MGVDAILIIDDDLDLSGLYEEAFRLNNIEAIFVKSINEARYQLKNRFYKTVLTDVFLENESGLESLKSLIRISPLTHFYTFTGQESIELAVRAIQLGAAGFFCKSMGYLKIVELISQSMKTKPLEEVNLDLQPSSSLVGQSSEMIKVINRIRQFGRVDSTVLITGESGTGKEVVTKELHRQSDRKDRVFEAINCGAIPENLLESELFGHKRGAFTDAKTDKKGLFEVCTKGTLMLDEIGDMPLSLQVKILRVLQEREIRPLGSNRSIKINPRIVACTHRNLEELVEQGKFRQDLLFRLSVLRIEIPPLRRRKDDIPFLLNLFIERFNLKFKKNVSAPSSEILYRLMDYDWPGNIRELQNAVERSVVLSLNNELKIEDIFPEDLLNRQFQKNDYEVKSLSHDKAKREFELSYINRLLTEADGNIAKAARISGKHRVEVYRLMEKYSISKNDFVPKCS